ncbi:MAG: chemotaxis protein CheX [Myxococcales bacterium]|nr:chemotaxis protein CheX [Myxococcales bacterium]
MRADIVNAIIEPVAAVIKSYVGDEPELMGIEVTSQIDPPPWIGVTVQLEGNIVGPITCVVSEGLARIIASKMAATDDVDPELCQEAVGELANIITGNATGKLIDAGYHVEITPPCNVAKDARQLTRKTLTVTLRTAAGAIKVLLGLRIHATRAA